MLSYLYLAFIIAGPILAVYTFKRPTPDLEKQYTRCLGAVVFVLLAGLFAPKTGVTARSVQASFALCFLACLFIHADYTRQTQTPSQAPLAVAAARARIFHSFRTLCFILSLAWMVYVFNIFGLLIFYYAIPVFVRILYPVRPMAPSPLRDQIVQIFKDAGVNLGQVFLIQSQTRASTNAMVCGTRWGVGPCKRTLLLTENVFERMTEPEFVAILRHEAAHFKLHHIRKRFTTAVWGYLMSVTLVMVPIFFVVSLMIRFKWRDPQIEMAMTILAALVSIYCFNRILFGVIRAQEHEADLEALKMGASHESLTAALQKITDDQGGQNRQKRKSRKLFLIASHPSLQDRIATLRTGIIERDSFLKPNAAKFAGLYTLLIASTVYFIASRPTATLDRSIASEPKESANISH